MRPLLTRDAVKSAAQARKAEKAATRKGVKKVNKKRGGKRFQGREIPELRAWIRGNACAFKPVSPCGVGVVEVMHVKSRGAGGGDHDNVLPACNWHHRLSHYLGQQSFARRYGVNLKALARQYTARWLREKGVLA